jgi:hypothetical protein
MFSPATFVGHPGQEQTKSGVVNMALVSCEVTEGPRQGFKTIGVVSIEGHTEYMAIGERFLVRSNDTWLLPVQIIGRDRRYDTALVQLPVEADSGANRVWVKYTLLRETPDEVPA